MELDSSLIKYQAYKSKRHSRNGSNSLFVPNVSPPSISRPPSTPANPGPSQNLATLSYHQSLPEKRDDALSNGFSLPRASTPGSSSTNGLPPDPRTNGHSRVSEPPSLSSSPRSSSSSHVIPPILDADPTMRLSNGLGTWHGTSNGDTNVTSNPMSSSPVPDSNKPLPPVRKTSKFRHVPIRNSKSPLPSSPLRPPGMHSRSTSLSSTSHQLEQPQHQVDTKLRSRVTSLSSLAFDTLAEKTLPPIVSSEIETSGQMSNETRISSDRPLPQPTESLVPPSRPSSLGPPQGSSRAPTPISATPSTTSSVSQIPPPVNFPTTTIRSPAPYRPGFQPKGVYRPRTDEFAEIRKLSNDRDRIERSKLERRLEKLIDLHFPRDSFRTVQPPANRRASSFFDFDLSDLRSKDAGGLLKGMFQGAKGDTRAAEQRITPWQEDSAVSKCPLCSASFHPLSNRKHHCRLCGKIICSLPVKLPHRPMTCSLLFFVDSKTRQIEEVGEGVDYGVRKRRSSTTVLKGKEREEMLSEDEKFLNGVRICRQCRPILLRQQRQYEVHHVPSIVRLYQAFIILEKEIEDSLPQFQELILNLSHDCQPTKEASAARKRLLEAFSQYDALAKRIRNLPTTSGPGDSHDRVQTAILTRSNLFLQKNMIPLQSLARPTKTAQDARKSNDNDNTSNTVIDLDSKLAHTLQPLLEQENLLEGFVEEAKARRKFEDAKTLKANLAEIRAEIDRIFAEADASAADKTSQTGKTNAVKPGG